MRIDLTRGCFTEIDVADLALVAGYSWVASLKRDRMYAMCYAGRGADGKKRYVYMHRLIINAGVGQEVDHVNGDGLDNRRINLRIASRSQNAANHRGHGGTSRYKGVNWHKQRQRWVANIKHCDQRQYLGLFDSEEGAALAYDEAAARLHGEFAFLNHRTFADLARHMNAKHPAYGNGEA